MFSPDLFPAPEAPRPDVLSDAQFLSAVEHEDLFAWCVNEVPWRDMHVRFSGGVERAIPRRLGWFGDVDYVYSGLHHAAAPMPVQLRVVADRIEAWLAQQGHDARFNSVLLNFYRDGNDSIGMHADKESQLESDPTIASLSLGATRTFKFRHIASGLMLTEPLTGGSLLVMKGDTQRKWLHGIPKEPGAGPRVNLTFRHTLRPAQ